MDLGLQGRVALVAGASSGLGLAVARELAREGAHVSIASRSQDRIDAAADEVRALGGGEVLAVEADVRSDDQVAAWVDATVERFGSIDVVMANAGGPPGGTATDFDLDGYRDAIELSLVSSIRVVQAALPHVRRSDQGRVLFLTSVSVKQPIPGLALSNTARAGVVGYAKSLMHALVGSSVTVNVLAPGLTRTERLKELEDAEGDTFAALAEDIPLGRLGEPEEFAAAVAFLASARASFINGIVLPVDGGASRGLL